MHQIYSENNFCFSKKEEEKIDPVAMFDRRSKGEEGSSIYLICRPACTFTSPHENAQWRKVQYIWYAALIAHSHCTVPLEEKVQFI